MGLSSPAGSGAEPQPKSNWVHISLKIRHLMETILMIFLRVLPKIFCGPATRGPQELQGHGSLNCLNPRFLRHWSRTSGLSREQRGYRKTKIGTEVGHVTRDSDTTFKVKRSKVNLQGREHILAASRTASYKSVLLEYLPCRTARVWSWLTRVQYSHMYVFLLMSFS